MKASIIGTLALITILFGCTKSKEKSISQLIEDAMASRTHTIYNQKEIEGRLANLTLRDRQAPADLGRALLFFGKTDLAIDLLEKTSADRESKFLLGVAYLKMAEEKNCVHHHNAQSCLFPIRENGIHTNKTWAGKALATFTDIAAKSPSSVDAKWLKEIVRSTLGATPNLQGIQYRNESTKAARDFSGTLMPFANEAESRGFLSHGWAAGGILDDFNNDGMLDILTSGSPHQTAGAIPRLELFLNDGQGKFQDRSQLSNLDRVYDGLYFNQTDFNNDGRLDVLVLRGGWSFLFDRNRQGLKVPFSLLRNNEDGTFTDVTIAAGLLNLAPTQAATWADFDGDGYLDLFVGFESTGGENFPAKLYRNNGDGHFVDISRTSGINAVGLIKSVSSGDIDGDGRPDLYIGFADRNDMLFKNITPSDSRQIQFVDIAADAGVAKQTPTFANWLWDYDNDGRLDILAFSTTPYLKSDDQSKLLSDAVDYYVGKGEKSEFSPPALYRNKGDGKFEDVSDKVGLNRVIIAMGCNFGDIDNDGFLDMYIGTGAPDLSVLIPNLMFWNRAGRHFLDITFNARVGHLQKGHSVAFGDVDRDGTQDILSVMGGALPSDSFQRALFINKNNKNSWINLKLRGTKANRMGVGAKVEAIISEHGRRRSVFATLGSGSSFGANPVSQLHIGLGSAKKIEKLIVRWPSRLAIKTEYYDLPVNQTLTLNEQPTQ